MIKDLADKMRAFSFKNKETYTYDDVVGILDDQRKGMINFLEPKVSTELQSITSEKEKFSSQYKELETKFETINKDKSEYEVKLENLNKELKPFKEEKEKTTAVELLKGKVVAGAEFDTFKELDLTGIDEVAEDKRDEFISSKLEPIFESKSYLKPAEVALTPKPGFEKDKLAQTEGNIEENSYVASHDDFGYYG